MSMTFKKFRKLTKYQNFIKRTFKILPKAVKPESSFCSAVIAAAGSSSRCAGGDKLFHKINGKPLLAYTLEAFENCSLVREIIIVAKAENLDAVAGIVKGHGLRKVVKIITGGETRTLSVLNGVLAVSKKAKLIAIHDGARPCIDVPLIEATIKAAAKYLAAAPGVHVIPTLKRAQIHSGSFGAVITETVGREGLYEIQTPQIFRAELIKAGLTDAVKNDVPLTDDCMAVERLGVPVHIVDGSRRNIKVTERDDLCIAEALLAVRD